MRKLTALIACGLLTFAVSAPAQWTNRYPKLEGYSHQIYLEQENLPILSSGPVYAAPSPDGKRLAFAHQGWIWLLELDSGTASQLTDGSGVDSRPRWSPDGKRLAFVRDSGSDTAVVIRDIATGSETTINSPAIDLDPEFSDDGNALYYSSGRKGRLELWIRDLASGADQQISEGGRVRRGARTLAEGGLVYYEPAYPGYRIRHRAANGEEDRVVFEQGWMAHLNPDAHPTENTIVYGVASDSDIRLVVMDIDKPSLPRILTPPGQRALFPAWSSDGTSIFYSVANDNQQFSLVQIPAVGGEPQEVAITQWDYRSALGTLSVSLAGRQAARISISRTDGHPIANPTGPTYSDSQNGPSYFYSDGFVELDLPEGRYRIVATRGPFSLPSERLVSVRGGEATEVALAIDAIWDPAAAGYASADYHIHLNSSGVHRLAADDILLPMQGESLDLAAPMAWNLYNRFVDDEKIGQTVSIPSGPIARYAQEVRSDFHGHIGLLGPKREFNPYFYGPRAPRYGDRDLHNGLVTDFANAAEALSVYVHPISKPLDPFIDFAANEPPLELVIDGVLAQDIGIELVCQWISPIAASELWYRFLNLGRTMPATGGTDMFVSFYRAPAIGTARSYLPIVTSGDRYDNALEQARAGKGFVSSGPALLFEAAGQHPGGVIAPGRHKWALELISVRPVERVEIIVNGKVVETFDGFAGKGSRHYAGQLDLPSGGWVAARAIGGETGWPVMSNVHFAHSQPIWIGQRGSTDPAAEVRAARDLLAALDYSNNKFANAYGEDVPPGLAMRIAAARDALTQIVAKADKR